MGEIRFVGTGETRGYPYLVCKIILFLTDHVISEYGDQVRFVTCENCGIYLMQLSEKTQLN